MTPHEVVDELTVVTAAAIEANASGLTSVLEQLADHDVSAEALAVDRGTDERFGPVADECRAPGPSRWP